MTLIRSKACRDGVKKINFVSDAADETQFHEAIDAFAGLDLIRIEPEVLLDISKCGFDRFPSLTVVFNDLGYLEGDIRCKDAEIPIRV